MSGVIIPEFWVSALPSSSTSRVALASPLLSQSPSLLHCESCAVCAVVWRKGEASEDCYNVGPSFFPHIPPPGMLRSTHTHPHRFKELDGIPKCQDRSPRLRCSKWSLARGGDWDRCDRSRFLLPLRGPESRSFSSGLSVAGVSVFLCFPGGLLCGPHSPAATPGSQVQTPGSAPVPGTRGLLQSPAAVRVGGWLLGPSSVLRSIIENHVQDVPVSPWTSRCRH